MATAALFIMMAIFIVLIIQRHLHNKTYTEAANVAVPALSPTQTRGKARLPKWMSPKLEENEVLYVNYWATWCEPCKDELSHIEKLSAELKSQGLFVLLVNLDSINDLELAKQIKNKYAPNLISVYEAESGAKKNIQLNALPFHILIDRNGKVANSFMGSIVKYGERFKHQVQQLLAEKVSL